jgi:tetratricopeptide (TPR) repeat protein
MTGRILILTLVIAAGTLRAETPEGEMAKANALYQQGKFEEAKDVYQAIASSGVGGGELYYNLGNAYYKTGDIARAILNYERAKRFLPADDDLLHNLQLANLTITDRIEATPRLFLWEYWDGVKSFFSLRGSMASAGGLFALMVGALVAVVLARTYALRKYAAIAALALCAIWLFAMAVFVAKTADSSRDDEAVIVASLTTVKNSPDPKSSDAFVLHAGVKVQITDSFTEWLKIRLADGKVGWLEKTALEII